MSFKDLREMWTEKGSPAFYGIESEVVDYVWDEVKEYLESSIADPDFESLDLIRKRLDTCEMQLWVGADPNDKIVVAAVTEIFVSAVNGHKRLMCAYVGGKGINDWIDFLYVYLENYALANGCDSVQIIGRRGWLRALPRYKEVSTNMINDLRE